MESAGSEYRKITPNAPEQILVTQVTSHLFIQVFAVCYFIAPPPRKRYFMSPGKAFILFIGQSVRVRPAYYLVMFIVVL